MGSQIKSKKRTKPPQGRPFSTSTISQPSVEDASHLTALSSFSPDGNHFAFLSLAVDKHRLRIYSTASGQSTAEHLIDSARVSAAITWSTFNSSPGQKYSVTDTEISPIKKKKRRQDSLPSGEQIQSQAVQVVILGLSDGTIIFFSPSHGRIIRTLSHPTSTAEILSIMTVERGDNTSIIWSSGADGVIRIWNAHKNDILGSWKNSDRIPYSFLAVRPTCQEGQIDILAAHHSIHLLSTSSDYTDFSTINPTQVASFTGHTSPVRLLQWDASQTPSRYFISLADTDRFLYIWQVPDGPSIDGKAVASIPLDSDARCFSLSLPQKSQDMKKNQTLLTLAASGKISLFPIPLEIALPGSSTRIQLPTLLPRSNLTLPSKSASTERIINATFITGEIGSICIARIVEGIRPVFNVVRYLDSSGDFISDIVIEDIKVHPPTGATGVASAQRYVEPPSLAVGSGVQLSQDEIMDDLTHPNINGDLDVDLAELSLGQRLMAVSGTSHLTSDSDDGLTQKEPRSSNIKNSQGEVTIVPANSLTRTLIQALHSSDSRLLETCLAHSDQTLIRNTVRRLPSQLAIPLIDACVERLGRGARAGNMKGGGGGASSQRGTGLIRWVKTTLALHSGHLMTIPDLVARLSGLYFTLTSRLSLQESLVSLSGRLDMVLTQIELRSSAAPAPLVPQKEKDSSKGTEVVRYVEGESGGESDNDNEMDIEVENESEEGSVEDIELGADSNDEDEASEDDEDEGDEDEDDSEGPTMNGFIDDEAEEYSEDDEDESE